MQYEHMMRFHGLIGFPAGLKGLEAEGRRTTEFWELARPRLDTRTCKDIAADGRYFGLGFSGYRLPLS